MEDIDILQKVIEKVCYTEKCSHYAELLDYLSEDEIRYKRYYSFIFSHDFAKAYFGEEEVDEDGRNLKEAWEFWKDEGHHFDIEDFESDFGFDIPTKLAWRHYLSQLVLSSKPLKYLEKFL